VDYRRRHPLPLFQASRFAARGFLHPFIPVIHHFLQLIVIFCGKSVFFAVILLLIPKKSTTFALSIENRIEEI